MWCCLVLASLLANGANSFAPAAPLSIRWGGLHAKRLVLAPEAFLNRASVANRDLVPPTKLQIWNEAGRISSAQMPYFTVRPDKTITLHSTDFCIEASGYESGDLVRLNHCTGGPLQLWNILSRGDGQTKHIHLDGTTKCLNVPEKGFDGASVDLLECGEKVTETWQLEKPIPLPAEAAWSEWQHGVEPARDFSSAMRHAMIGICSMVFLGAFSLGAWMWGWQRKTKVVAAMRSGAPLNIDQGGVSLTLHIVVPPQGALILAQENHTGGRSTVTMTATPNGESGDISQSEGGKLTATQKEEVGNLVADDEWLGFGMEMGIIMRSSIRESLKSSVRDFTGKDDYKIGEVSKELDARVKARVAELRNKEEYELGDLSLALDTIAKEEVKKMTGKDDYEFGDLSIELDKRVKGAVANFCGKETYTPGDLNREISRRSTERLSEYVGKDYEFGDVSREIERRRVEWVQDFLGKEGYEFGDLTQKLVSNFTGKEDYEFGDITKQAVANFTGKEAGEYQFGDITKALGQKLFGNKQAPKKK